MMVVCRGAERLCRGYRPLRGGKRPGRRYARWVLVIDGQNFNRQAVTRYFGQISYTPEFELIETMP